MGEAFRLGGWGMIPTAAFGLMLVVAALRYALAPEKRFIPLQIALAIVTLASGTLGFVTGLIKSTQAIPDAPENMRWIWVVGMGEALHCVALALVLVTLAAIAAGIGAGRVAAEGSARPPVA